MKHLPKTIQAAKASCRNPQCVNLAHRWIVVNCATGEALQSEATQAQAVIACRWVNEHESRNGRDHVYAVREVTSHA